MRNSTLLLGEFLWGSPYRLDILTIILKIIFNYNLFPCFPCGPWIFYHRNLDGFRRMLNDLNFINR